MLQGIGAAGQGQDIGSQQGFAGQHGAAGQGQAEGQQELITGAAGQHGVASGAEQHGAAGQQEELKDWYLLQQAAELGSALTANTKSVPIAINCFFIIKSPFSTFKLTKLS